MISNTMREQASMRRVTLIKFEERSRSGGELWKRG
jgi:hypothetical protein